MFFVSLPLIHFLQPNRLVTYTGILSVAIGFCMDSVLWYGIIHISALLALSNFTFVFIYRLAKVVVGPCANG